MKEQDTSRINFISFIEKHTALFDYNTYVLTDMWLIGESQCTLRSWQKPEPLFMLIPVSFNFLFIIQDMLCVFFLWEQRTEKELLSEHK